MLRAGLKGLFDDSQIEAVGVAPTARAETVDIAGFAHARACPGNGLTATATHEDVLKSVSPVWRSCFSRSAARMAWT